MKTINIPTTKILSFTGMVLSMALLILLVSLNLSLMESISPRESVMFIIAMAITGFFFVISIIAAKQFNWGDKNSFTPMT